MEGRRACVTRSRISASFPSGPPDGVLPRWYVPRGGDKNPHTVGMRLHFCMCTHILSVTYGVLLNMCAHRSCARRQGARFRDRMLPIACGATQEAQHTQQPHRALLLRPPAAVTAEHMPLSGQHAAAAAWSGQGACRVATFWVRRRQPAWPLFSGAAPRASSARCPPSAARAQWPPPEQCRTAWCGGPSSASWPFHRCHENLGKCQCHMSHTSRQMSRHDMTSPHPDPRQMSRHDMTFGHTGQKFRSARCARAVFGF